MCEDELEDEQEDEQEKEHVPSGEKYQLKDDTSCGDGTKTNLDTLRELRRHVECLGGSWEEQEGPTHTHKAYVYAHVYIAYIARSQKLVVCSFDNVANM